MRIDEQGRAAAVPAEHFEQAAVARLRQLEAAATLGEARAQNSELSQSADDIGRDLRIAVDGYGIDLAIAKLPQFGREIGDLPSLRQIGIRQEPVVQVLAEE